VLVVLLAVADSAGLAKILRAVVMF
jgi:hypothetical protein